jgi:hypothetical protein
MAAGVTACAADDSPGPGKTTTTKPALPDGQCVARMSDANPGQGGTETVIIDSHVASQPVKVTAHYKSTDSTYSGSLDSDKHAEVEFSIGKPTVGYTVVVEVTAGSESTSEKCQSSFTPH